MAEERGFECLLFPEHTHIPGRSRDAGARRWRVALALQPHLRPVRGADRRGRGATERLLIGTGICLVIERDPIITAKEVASIDVLSGGRFLFGVGAGWNVEEMRNHGTEPSRRFAVMRERIEAMKAIWTEEEASYSGSHVGFERIWCWPKPAQKPHPPVLVGGNGPRVLDRVLAYGDEWMPNRMSDEDLAARIGELNARASEAGREPIPVTVVGMAPDPERIERLGAGRRSPRGVLAPARERGRGRAGVRPLRRGDGAVRDRGLSLSQPR